MKTIRQRLQSRISLRRNFINALEIKVADTKRTLSALHSVNTIMAIQKKEVYRDFLAKTRQGLAELRDDQKLDKELYRLALQDERMQRMMADYHHSPLFLAECAIVVLEIVGE